MSSALPHPETHEFPPPDSVWWPKEHEEAWAEKVNFPTKLAGWLTLGYVILAACALFIPKAPAGNIDLLSVVAGICILRGHQAWLRYATLMSCVASAGGMIVVMAKLVFGPPPSSMGGLQFHFGDQDSWVQMTAALGVAMLDAVVCVLALRSRRLVFWTRPTKIFGGLFLAVVGFGLGDHLITRFSIWQTEQALISEFEPQIQAVERHLDTRGSTVPFDPEPALRAHPRIRMVYWNDNHPNFSSGIRGVIYDREPPVQWRGEGDLVVPHTTTSGDSGAIVFYLDPPP